LAELVQSDQFAQWIENIVNWLTNDLPVAIQNASNFWTNVLKPAIEAYCRFSGRSEPY